MTVRLGRVSVFRTGTKSKRKLTSLDSPLSLIFFFFPFISFLSFHFIFSFFLFTFFPPSTQPYPYLPRPQRNSPMYIALTLIIRYKPIERFKKKKKLKNGIKENAFPSHFRRSNKRWVILVGSKRSLVSSVRGREKETKREKTEERERKRNEK